MDPAWRGKPREDTTRPATWRWVAFVTLCLVIVSFWVPPMPSEVEAPTTSFTLTNASVLLVFALLAAWVVPATWRFRLAIFAVLLGTTAIAWSLEGPIGRLLGAP